jgi:hypothetical protein
MLFSALDTPIRSQKRRMALAGYPRRRTPLMVGMRGSSHPWTCFSVTSWMSFRFDSTVYCKLRRENSVCVGRHPSLSAYGRRPLGFTESIDQSYSGRWSANSNVHSECVIPSSASLIACAKSYMG